MVELSPTLSDELSALAANIQEPARLADFIAGSLPSLNTAQRQEFLETLDVRIRLDRINKILVKDLEVLEVGSKIQNQVKTELQKNQREYYLREQMKAIQKELGDGDDQQREYNELKDKIEKAGMPEDVKKEALRELDRLSKMSPAAAEYTVTRTYLDWLVMLPWAKRTEMRDRPPQGQGGPRQRPLRPREGQGPHPRVPGRAQDEARHQGPDPVLRGPSRASGKTSLGRSIASSMGRKFHRLSLGGMRDEAEIRGHRRTYIGALPGQIIQGLRRAESKNPVFMLDEVDKLGADFRGDPASALLEVLDPEQNNTFKDHYIDVPFDLSEVLFICTANVLDTIPPALRDRMEVIRLAGYTEEDKLHIARRHIIPRQLDNHGISAEILAFGDDALVKLIREYTREAGLRNLEREIASIIRKVARKRAEGHDRHGGGHPGEGRGVPGRALLHARGDGRAHPHPRRGPGPVLDRGRRRDPLHRGLPDVRQEGPEPHRPARRRDEGERADRPLLGARPRAAARHRGLVLRARGPAPARARGRHPQGRPLGRHHPGHRHRLAADRPSRAAARGHDRRDDPLGPRAARGRHQGEGAGRPPPRREGSPPARSATRRRSRKTCRRTSATTSRSTSCRPSRRSWSWPCSPATPYDVVRERDRWHLRLSN